MTMRQLFCVSPPIFLQSLQARAIHSLRLISVLPIVPSSGEEWPALGHNLYCHNYFQKRVYYLAYALPLYIDLLLFKNSTNS